MEDHCKDITEEQCEKSYLTRQSANQLISWTKGIEKDWSHNMAKIVVLMERYRRRNKKFDQIN
jgi:hypothetical protein